MDTSVIYHREPDVAVSDIGTRFDYVALLREPTAQEIADLALVDVQHYDHVGWTALIEHKWATRIGIPIGNTPLWP